MPSLNAAIGIAQMKKIRLFYKKKKKIYTKSMKKKSQKFHILVCLKNQKIAKVIIGFKQLY